VHAECPAAWRLAPAPTCPVGGTGGVGPFYDGGGGVKVHGEGGCYAEYMQKQKERTSDRCAHCGGPVCKVPGQ
jgi:hypothetical protein